MLLMGSIAMGSITDPKKAARIAPGGLFENPPAGFRTGQGGQRLRFFLAGALALAAVRLSSMAA